jgi:hypothetical protein
MAAIMRDEPPELSESGRNISPALDRIVKHCLKKDRNHRFQSARDLAFNLLEQSSASATSGAREIAAQGGSGAVRADEGFWVAVLPFKYSGASADLMALADGDADTDPRRQRATGKWYGSLLFTARESPITMALGGPQTEAFRESVDARSRSQYG